MARFPSVRDKPKTLDVFRISWTRPISRPERLALRLERWDAEGCSLATIAECEDFQTRLDPVRRELRLFKRKDFHSATIVVPQHGKFATLKIDVRTFDRRDCGRAARFWGGHLDWLFEVLYESHLIQIDEDNGIPWSPDRDPS